MGSVCHTSSKQPKVYKPAISDVQKQRITEDLKQGVWIQPKTDMKKRKTKHYDMDQEFAAPVAHSKSAQGNVAYYWKLKEREQKRIRRQAQKERERQRKKQRRISIQQKLQRGQELTESETEQENRRKERMQARQRAYKQMRQKQKKRRKEQEQRNKKWKNQLARNLSTKQQKCWWEDQNQEKNNAQQDTVQMQLQQMNNFQANLELTKQHSWN